MPRKGKFTSPPEEPQWIARAREGDKEAYRKLVEHYQDRLFGLVFSMVRKREPAEDLTQEIFIKVYFALNRFEGDSAFYTWLFRIASNHCLDFLRKRQPSQVSLDSPIDEDRDMAKIQTLEAPATERPEAGLEDQAELGGLLADLEPDQRMVLNLREFQGYSYEEIAVILKCGVNTVKSRLNRAREAFKRAYNRKFGPTDPVEGNISESKYVEEDEDRGG